MCKHILFNDFKRSDIDTLKEFIRLTYDRDGYGSIIRDTKGRIETLKCLDSGLFYAELMHRLMDGNVQTLVVHHRTSTNERGLASAHPFEFKDHYLTHNGVVYVPGSHATKTKNDSEALLHHLIKTEYDTKSISGYFSCFVLSKSKTTVLVDDIAPIYTDGRIYSSHQINPEFKKIEKVMLDLCPKTGDVHSKREIELTKTDYGKDKRHLSLSKTEVNITNDDNWIPEAYDADFSALEVNDKIIEFFDCITDQEEKTLYELRNLEGVDDYIKELALSLGITLNNDDIQLIKEYVCYI